MIEVLLKNIGVPLDDPNLVGTPERYERALRELLSGYNTAPPDLKVFPSSGGCDLIFSGPLITTSLCPHHMLPYLLRAYFAYTPNEKVVGISKPGRLLGWTCSRFILQEELGSMFLSHFNNIVKPNGSIILLRGWHLCASIRGAKQKDSTTTTITAFGHFKEEKHRANFMDLVRSSGNLSI